MPRRLVFPLPSVPQVRNQFRSKTTSWLLLLPLYAPPFIQSSPSVSGYSDCSTPTLHRHCRRYLHASSGQPQAIWAQCRYQTTTTTTGVPRTIKEVLEELYPDPDDAVENEEWANALAKQAIYDENDWKGLSAADKERLKDKGIPAAVVNALDQEIVANMTQVPDDVNESMKPLVPPATTTRGPRTIKQVLEELYPDQDDAAKIEEMADALAKQGIVSENHWNGLSAAAKESLWGDKIIPEAVVNALDGKGSELKKISDFEQLCNNQGGTPFVPEEHRHQQVGGKAFRDELVDKVKGLLKFKTLSKQETVAMAVVAASGVGKTFSTICFPVAARGAIPEAHLLLAYVGFNINCGLTFAEQAQLANANKIVRAALSTEQARVSRPLSKEEINAISIPAANAVSQVILSRLFGALLLLRKHKDALQPIVKCDVFPLVPVVVSDTCTLLGVSVLALMEKVQEAALALQSAIDRRVVVVVNVDEAHQLDELISFDGPQGARLALRVLRLCQLTIYNKSDGNMLLFPIATGVNPKVSLPDETDGCNLSTSRTLLSCDEFTEFTVATHSALNHKAIYAAAVYPRVRAMLLGTKVTPINVTNCDKTMAAKLLVHTLNARPMPRAEVPTQIATKDSAHSSVPILDLAVWESLVSDCLKLSNVGMLPFPLPLEFGNETAQSPEQFEVQAFQVIGFTLQLFWNPDPAMKDARAAFCRANNECFTAAFGFPAAFNCFRYAMIETDHYYQPFNGCKDHVTACQGDLSAEFLQKVKAMEPSSGILFWAGLSAPLAYVLLVKGADGTSCHARYGDAKQESCNDTPAAQKRVQKYAKAHGSKAKMVHHGLTRELRKLGLQLDAQFTVALVTNIPTSFKRVNGVVVLGPSTFQFKPWTEMLYRRAE